MNRVKYIFRVVFFLLAVILIVYLNKKTDDNVGSVTEFKFKMIEKLGKDSLDSKHKLELLQKETTKFINDSSHVRTGIDYLMGLLGIAIAFELGFLVMAKRTVEKNTTT